MVLLIIMVYGEHDAYNNEFYMPYDELHSQIDKNRKIVVAGTPV
jgi:hypothetical protein